MKRDITVAVILRQSHAPAVSSIELAEPFEVGRAAGAAGVAHVGGDVAAGEFEMGLAERGEGLERVVVRGLVDLAARVGQAARPARSARDARAA